MQPNCCLTPHYRFFSPITIIKPRKIEIITKQLNSLFDL